MNVGIYILGIVLQAVAALIALIEVRSAPRKLPWVLIALSSLLIVVRRAASPDLFMHRGSAPTTAEVLPLIISSVFFCALSS